MKKSILNLAGAQELTKKEQKSLNGGIKSCQRLFPDYTLGQCNNVGGYFMSGRGCLVTYSPCGPEITLEP